MDDAKLNYKDNDELERLLHTMKTFNDYIRMEFWFDKCAKTSF